MRRPAGTAATPRLFRCRPSAKVKLQPGRQSVLAEGLNREAQVRLEDVFINLVEVNKANWSFGMGVAQYVT